jgi:hypothetical protein
MITNNRGLDVTVGTVLDGWAVRHVIRPRVLTFPRPIE